MEFIDSKEYQDLIGIYKIKNIINGKSYIGQTREKFIRRYWLHRWSLKENKHSNNYLQKAWNKHGEDNFEFSVVEVVTDLSVIDDREIYYISEQRKTQSGCYNLADGGGGKSGCPMSERARKIVGAKNRAHNLGKKASEDTKKKMAEKKFGVPCLSKRNNVDPELIRIAKQRIMNGQSSVAVAKELQVSYGVINGILCRHTWSDVFVDGWEDFLANRTTYTRKPKIK